MQRNLRLAGLGVGVALLGAAVLSARADEPPAPGAPGAAPAVPPVAVAPPAPFPARAERLETKLTAAKSYRTNTDPALHDALRWLAAHQSPNGRWESAGFEKWCNGKASEEAVRPDGAGDKAHDVGVTGLALCAVLGAGYTDRGDHEFRKVVRRGLTYLAEIQDEEGCIGRREGARWIYNHATAALALVEAYGMTEDTEWLEPARKALRFLELAQNPFFGWRYGVKPGDNDTSVTGWMAHVLASARLVNEDAVRRGKADPLPFDAKMPEGIRNWLDKVTAPSYGGVGYRKEGTPSEREPGLEDKFPAVMSEALTATGTFARVMLLRQVPYASTSKPPAGTKPESLVLRESVKRLGRRAFWSPPELGLTDLIEWYFTNLALHQVGGEPWTQWSKTLPKSLIENQRSDGTPCGFKGSWDPIDPWGGVGGRVYTTALCALCLETPYRYPRVLAKSR